jgi:RNA polymerase sigma factor (TIGR02999 family)
VTSGDGTTAFFKELIERDHDVSGRLAESVYIELKELARSQLRGERSNHTLQATALAHEACLRLRDMGGDCNDLEHLFHTAAKVMRQILVDYARKRHAQKRGGEMLFVPLDHLSNVPPSWKTLDIEDVLALDELLARLKERDPRLSMIVEMRFFAGLSDDEIAEALKLSKRTVVRDWHMARAWLHGKLRPARRAEA